MTETVFIPNFEPSLASVLFAVSWRLSRITWLFLNVIPLGRLCLDPQEQTESSLDEIDMFGEEGCKKSDVHDMMMLMMVFRKSYSTRYWYYYMPVCHGSDSSN